jgi:hypothetical protein
MLEGVEYARWFVAGARNLTEPSRLLPPRGATCPVCVAIAIGAHAGHGQARGAGAIRPVALQAFG